jgi:hypothetical protein
MNKDSDTFLSQEAIKAAIAELDIAATTCETNEPISRSEGKTEQADLERNNARAYRGAIEILKRRLI